MPYQTAEYPDPDRPGKWIKEWAIAPVYTPPWLRVAGHLIDYSWSHEDDVPKWVVEIWLPPSALQDPNHAKQEEDAWRENYLNKDRTRKGYRGGEMTSHRHGTSAEWDKWMRETQIRFDGDPVSWYDVDIGLVFPASLYDLAHVKQGTVRKFYEGTDPGTWESWLKRYPDAQSDSAWLKRYREAYEQSLANYEESKWLLQFDGHKLWLLADKMFAEAHFPMPIRYGPPYCSASDPNL